MADAENRKMDSGRVALTLTEPSLRSQTSWWGVRTVEVGPVYVEKTAVTARERTLHIEEGIMVLKATKTLTFMSALTQMFSQRQYYMLRTCQT